jgi:hypothetical protein
MPLELRNVNPVRSAYWLPLIGLWIAMLNGIV